MKDLIYLDHAATSFPKSESVYHAMDEANRTLAVNAGRASYRLAKKASNIIEETKNEILGLIGPNQVAEVIFTPSATIALNQVIKGISWEKKDVVYVSPFEHNAVMRTLHSESRKYGFAIRELPVEKVIRDSVATEESIKKASIQELAIDMEQVRYEFASNKPDYVFATQVSNVTGYILPIADISEEVKKYEGFLIVDGAQGFGIVETNLKLMDIYVFAGHKAIGGPLGIGGFITNGKLKLEPVLVGGTGSDSLNLEMPEKGTLRYEPASPNIVATVGLLHAVRERKEKTIRNAFEHECNLRKQIQEGLLKNDKVVIYGMACGIIAFNINGYEPSDVGLLLDEDYDICVRTGYHCASLIHKHLDTIARHGMVRVSVGNMVTEDDVRSFLKAIDEICEG